ncbi:MAG: response regulator transcription factor [Rhodospirillaceae bacterium]|nr:response regulator transcription factor [Rhodospirillaceae bacterium]
MDNSKVSQTPPRILVVEDDPFVRDVLDIYLRGEGYEVTLTTDGKDMRRVLADTPIHLVIMDLRLPGEDGFALTRYLREQYKTLGIIILSTRHEIMDRVVGLECGADDYLTKPFEERELLARIRSVLRRTGALAATPQDARNEVPHGKLTYQGWTLDQDAGLFRSKSGAEAMLTGNECRLLGHLIRNAGKVQTREDLMDKVLSREWDPMDRSIDVLVTRLRHKIEVDPKRPVMIKTVRGSGYILSPHDAAASETAA